MLSEPSYCAICAARVSPQFWVCPGGRHGLVALVALERWIMGQVIDGSEGLRSLLQELGGRAS